MNVDVLRDALSHTTIGTVSKGTKAICLLRGKTLVSLRFDSDRNRQRKHIFGIHM